MCVAAIDRRPLSGGGTRAPARFRLSASLQQALDDRQHRPSPGGGQLGEPLAGAHEEVDAQFFFEFADLAAQPGCEVCSTLDTSVRLTRSARLRAPSAT